jgi:hypothetical protein
MAYDGGGRGRRNYESLNDGIMGWWDGIDRVIYEAGARESESESCDLEFNFLSEDIVSPFPPMIGLEVCGTAYHFADAYVMVPEIRELRLQ